MEKITEYLIRPTVTEQGIVRAWEEEILLPTYQIGEEEKNPLFLEKRVYQGSSGTVYPYPVVEKISDEKSDKPYRALFLENEYIKIMILPELGGRVQMAYDKIKKRHFVYYNQVIKPALVGLTGPWISGGIEFNWPQHHRPSTFLPTEYSIEENPDGSKTVWCNEVERMFRTKGMQGFTLHPGKAYLEIKVKVYNRTPLPQTFLWWANPAVVVHDDYHSVFPPDVHAVFDHGKRDVSDFPIAKGIYYKQDYSAGVDISLYKNIPVPTSYMAIKSKFDFVGGYEKNTQGGLLHVANHHVSPGKKQWTWGYGDFGKAWDRNLTDEDGPYIELMTGVYTDNQPDFSWLQPYEEKSWAQYFMPYSEVGYVKNANKEAIVNIDVQNGQTSIILYTTSVYKNLRVKLCCKSQSCGSVQKDLLDKVINCSPEEPLKITVPSGDALPEELVFELFTEDGKLLLSYQAEKQTDKTTPNPAKAAKQPKEIESIEQLFLTGLHLEQYRHATYNPTDYYLEALRREPGDIRCNNAMGLLLIRKGQFAKAEPYLRKAVETLTERNPNPYDGESYYNLGWCQKMQGKNEEAYDALFKATWNAAWQDAGHLALAQIDSLGARCTVNGKRWGEALENVEKSLIRNWHNHKARQLKASILRKIGRNEEALKWIEDSLKIDRFNMGCLFEKYLITKDENIMKEIHDLMKGRVHSYIEYALDFAAAGLYEEAEELLREYVSVHGTRYTAHEKDTMHCAPDTVHRVPFTVYPIVYYALGYFASQTGDSEQAKSYYQQAGLQSPEKCFPNRIEEVNILQDAIRMNPTDAKAPYYLGNFWYASRQYPEAIGCWEKSASLDDQFPTVWRNLALAYYNKLNDKGKARIALEKSFELDPSDARIFMELDQLYKKTGCSYQERLDLLEKYQGLVEQRDDLYIEKVTLYNSLGKYEKAKDLLATRQFHPWEGGEGKATGQYTFSLVELAKKEIEQNNFEKALDLLVKTESYPHNLGEGKLANAEENDINYNKGIAYQGLKNEEKARYWFEKATKGSSEPQQAFFYNDQQPDKIFYQGLAWKVLGNDSNAEKCFKKLIEHGEKHLSDNCKIDYFAVSLPDLAIWEDDLNKRNQIHCHFVIGLGYLGLGIFNKAKQSFDEVLKLDINHQGAKVHQQMCSLNNLMQSYNQLLIKQV